MDVVVSKHIKANNLSGNVPTDLMHIVTSDIVMYMESKSVVDSTDGNWWEY